MRKLLSLLLVILVVLPATALADLPSDTAKQVVITFLGDCTLGCTELTRAQATSFDSVITQNGFAYPFEMVQSVIAHDDLTVANLEGVFYNYELNKVDKTYNFRSSMDFAQILPLGSVEAVCLSNNHTGDYGAQGMRDTVAALEENGVQWFGANEYANNVYVFEKDGVKIGFVASYISYWWRNREVITQCFNDLKAAGCDVIIANIHGGVEYDIRHDSNQEQMANSFINYGADIIIGHHPHVLQGMAVQNGRTVLYSLGNFVFGGNKELRAVATVMAQFTFCFDENNNYLGHQLNLIPAQVSGTLDRNNYQPILAEGKMADTVMAAIQKDTKLKLQPYVEGIGAVQDFVPAQR